MPGVEIKVQQKHTHCKEQDYENYDLPPQLPVRCRHRIRIRCPDRLRRLCFQHFLFLRCCSSEAAGESVELIVFAAASLTETLNAIAETTLPRTRA